MALHRPRALTVRVVDEAGEPQRDSTVELLRSAGRTRFASKSHIHDRTSAFDGRGAGTFMIVATEQARTDAVGVARLAVGPELGSAALRVTGARHQPKLVELAGAPPAELRVEVEAAAVIDGKLRPLDVVAAWGPSDAERAEAARHLDPEDQLESSRPEVVLVRDDRRVASTPVGDDGVFRIGPVAPGDYELRFEQRGIEHSIGEVKALRGGEVRNVQPDVTAQRPARLRGRVTVDGEAPHSGELRLRGDRGATTVGVATDGTFEFAQLLAGSYRLSYQVTTRDGQWPTWNADEPIALRAGEGCSSAAATARPATTAAGDSSRCPSMHTRS